MKINNRTVSPSAAGIHESHGYAARESVMHTLWEQHQWLDRHVKNAAPRMETTQEVGRR